MTLADYLVPTGAALLLATLLVSVLKPYLEASVLPPTSSLHDSTLRILTVLLAIGVALAANALLHQLTPQGAFLVVVQGVLGGLGAVGTYHVLSGEKPPENPLPH